MELATKSDPNALIGACVVSSVPAHPGRCQCLSAILTYTQSLYFVGGVFGCIACPVVADVWGRKVAIVAVCLPLL